MPSPTPSQVGDPKEGGLCSVEATFILCSPGDSTATVKQKYVPICSCSENLLGDSGLDQFCGDNRD